VLSLGYVVLSLGYVVLSLGYVVLSLGYAVMVRSAYLVPGQARGRRGLVVLTGHPDKDEQRSQGTQ